MYANLLLFQTLSWKVGIPSTKSSRRLVDNEIFMAHWANYLSKNKNFQGCKTFFSEIERYITVSLTQLNTGRGIPSTRSSPRLVGNEIFLTHWANLCSMICNKCMPIYSYFRPYLGRGAYPQQKVLVVSLTTRYFGSLTQLFSDV